MVDVKKVLRLTSDEWNMVKDLMELYHEAEGAVETISHVWKFEMNVNEITVKVGNYGHKLTHDGRWIIGDKEVNIDEDSIYQLFVAKYLKDRHLESEAEESEKEIINRADICEYFRDFLNFTKQRA